jgi:recombination protein RecA
MGLQARLMSQACRKLVGISNRANTTIIWINQIRSKIGVFFGNPETTTGGNALKFYAAIRLEARKEETLKEGDKIIGHNMKVKVVKNKLAAPHNIAIFPLVYGRGVDVVGDVFDQAVLKKVVNKAGSWYSYGEDKLGQGRNQAIEAVIAKKLLPTIKEKLDEVSQVTSTPES